MYVIIVVESCGTVPSMSAVFKDKHFSFLHGKEGMWQPLLRPGGRGRAKIGQRT
jgi:hypothetical protein